MLLYLGAVLAGVLSRSPSKRGGLVGFLDSARSVLKIQQTRSNCSKCLHPLAASNGELCIENISEFCHCSFRETMVHCFNAKLNSVMSGPGNDFEGIKLLLKTGSLRNAKNTTLIEAAKPKDLERILDFNWRCAGYANAMLTYYETEANAAGQQTSTEIAQFYPRLHAMNSYFREFYRKHLNDYVRHFSEAGTVTAGTKDLFTSGVHGSVEETSQLFVDYLHLCWRANKGNGTEPALNMAVAAIPDIRQYISLDIIVPKVFKESLKTKHSEIFYSLQPHFNELSDDAIVRLFRYALKNNSDAELLHPRTLIKALREERCLGDAAQLGRLRKIAGVFYELKDPEIMLFYQASGYLEIAASEAAEDLVANSRPSELVEYALEKGAVYELLKSDEVSDETKIKFRHAYLLAVGDARILDLAISYTDSAVNVNRIAVSAAENPVTEDADNSATAPAVDPSFVVIAEVYDAEPAILEDAVATISITHTGSCESNSGSCGSTSGSCESNSSSCASNSGSCASNSGSCKSNSSSCGSNASNSKASSFSENKTADSNDAAEDDSNVAAVESNPAMESTDALPEPSNIAETTGETPADDAVAV
ncbi:hypothetical protein PAPHI01_1882 [Pancytospora philotis]|nr:hypothetical protein PAPHI01_1882 [Pancytospora philotis]